MTVSCTCYAISFFTISYAISLCILPSTTIPLLNHNILLLNNNPPQLLPNPHHHSLPLPLHPTIPTISTIYMPIHLYLYSLPSLSTRMPLCRHLQYLHILCLHWYLYIIRRSAFSCSVVSYQIYFLTLWHSLYISLPHNYFPSSPIIILQSLRIEPFLLLCLFDSIKYPLPLLQPRLITANNKLLQLLGSKLITNIIIINLTQIDLTQSLYIPIILIQHPKTLPFQILLLQLNHPLYLLQHPLDVSKTIICFLDTDMSVVCVF